MSEPTIPGMLVDYLPRVEGNALICSDGTCHQLRILEKLYLRCGVLTVAELDKRYRQDKPRG